MVGNIWGHFAISVSIFLASSFSTCSSKSLSVWICRSTLAKPALIRERRCTISRNAFPVVCQHFLGFGRFPAKPIIVTLILRIKFDFP